MVYFGVMTINLRGERWLLEFTLLELASNPRFEMIRDGALVAYGRYQSTFLFLRVIRLPWRWGVKVYRYPKDSGPSLRLWWGRWESGCVILWGKRRPLGAGGSELHQEIVDRSLGLWKEPPPRDGGSES